MSYWRIFLVPRKRMPEEDQMVCQPPKFSRYSYEIDSRMCFSETIEHREDAVLALNEWTSRVSYR